MRVRMRQAQRKMKGVKLQYTDANRVTFDDVAGVGPAKVGFPSVHVHRFSHCRPSRLGTDCGRHSARPHASSVHAKSRAVPSCLQAWHGF